LAAGVVGHNRNGQGARTPVFPRVSRL